LSGTRASHPLLNDRRPRRRPPWRLLDTASPAVDTYYRGAQIVADINGQRAVLIASGGRPNRFDTIWVFTGRGWAAAIALP
jgi:hypothetical protein